MFNAHQFRLHIIRPCLDKVGLYAPEAEELLIAIMAHESLGGTYIKQIEGPALGIYQMEKTTHDSIWDNFLVFRHDLAHKIVLQFNKMRKPSAEEMIHDLFYATLMARIYFLRVSDALPPANDIDAIWQYYKSFYNTAIGKAKKEDFVKNYKKFTANSPPELAQA